MSAESSVEPSGTPHRVAVIAVHGVGHADPGGTVRHLADLLLGLGRFKLNPPDPQKVDAPPQVPWGPATPPYTSFKTQPIQVALKAAPVSHREEASQRMVDVIAQKQDPNNPKPKASFWLKFHYFLDERRGYIASVFANRKPTPKITAGIKEGFAEDRAKLGHEFMRAQLAGYASEPEGKSYDTIRLETERPGDDKTPPKTVHLYEAYWADLARPQNSVLSFFLAFYQLLLHLGSLSRTAVDYATVEHYEHRSWRWHTFWQGWAVRFLVLPITILNLYLLLAGMSGLPSQLGKNHSSLIASVVLGAMALVVVLWWPRLRDAPTSPTLWIVFLAGAFGLGSFAGRFLTHGGLPPDFLLSIEWWLLGGALLYLFVIKPYDEVRRGAAVVGFVFYGLSLTGFLYCLYRAAQYPQPHANQVDQASFWTMQLIMFGMILSWLGMLLCVLCAWVLHFRCLWVLRKKDFAERTRARAALRTGRLTLATSASLFLVLTIFLWDGVYNFTRQKLHLHSHIQVTQVPLPLPIARVFRVIVPTLNDAIRWTHQPAKSARSNETTEQCLLRLESRLARLEQWDWNPNPICLRQIPAATCCAESSKPLDTGTLSTRIAQLETNAKAGFPSTSHAFDAPLEVEDSLYRLERYARLAKLKQWNWSRNPKCAASSQPVSMELTWAPAPKSANATEVPPAYDVDVAEQLGILERAAKTGGGSINTQELAKTKCLGTATPIDSTISKTGDDDTQPFWVTPLDTESRLFRLELKTQPNSEKAVDTYAKALLLVSATSGLPILLIGFGLALTLLVWAVVPSLLADPSVLADNTKFNNTLSQRLGNWYSRGLDSTRVITFLMWHAIFTMAFVFGALDFAYSHGWINPNLAMYSHFPCLQSVVAGIAWCMEKITGVALQILDIVGRRLAVSGTVVLALVYQKGRVVLDIILDVDHYLRTSPLDRAPRARIAERYTSLLRYIATQKDEHGKPYYTSVVIAAHSLGAVISADLLQYLKREGEIDPDPELDSLGFRQRVPLKEGEPESTKPTEKPATPIYLLTFGNPLRQLLNRYFPHLYWWIREEPDNAYAPLPNAVTVLPMISNDATPEPAKLNVRRWVSAYRSGDFVGRSLWLDGWFARTKGRAPDAGAYPEELAIAYSSNKSRAEACIGLGGHNNYWDRTAPDMAHELDKLICWP